MIADASWDVAGIVASFATLVTAVAGAVILVRKNTSQHANNLGSVQNVAKAVADVVETISTIQDGQRRMGEDMKALRREVSQGGARNRSDRETLFTMIAELDSKVSLWMRERVG